jgi:hypothetical protein
VLLVPAAACFPHGFGGFRFEDAADCLSGVAGVVADVGLCAAVGECGADGVGAWPDMWPADKPRYMPEIVAGENGCQVRYVWAAPGDPHAPALIPRPESLKDYSDYDD